MTKLSTLAAVVLINLCGQQAFAQCTTSGTSPNISINCPGSSVPASATVLGSDAGGNLLDNSHATIANNTTGNAATASALAAAGTTCPSGQAAGGVDAHGNAINCFTPSGSGGGSSSPVYKVETGNYTMLPADFSGPAPACGVIVVKNGSSNVLTVPPSTSQPPAGQCVHIVVIGGSAILTANGQTVSNGTYYYPSATIQLNSGNDVFLYSDGTNFTLNASIVSAIDNDSDEVIGSINIGGGPAGASGATQLGGGQGVITGGQDLIIGWEALNGSTMSGAYNTLVGDSVSKGNNFTGSYNTILGAAISNREPFIGNYNLLLGFGTATSGEISGSNNICLGAEYLNGYKGVCYTLGDEGGSNNLIIGAGTQADVPNTSTSNYVNINNWLIGDWSKGFFMYEGPAPHISGNACGSATQGVLKSGSTDVSGEVTIGTSGVSACAVAFANTHGAVPNCVVTPHSANTVGLYVSAESTSGFTVSSASAMDGGSFAYYCPGSSNATNPVP